MLIEQHIEELRQERLNAVCPVERREIEAELKRALAELDTLPTATEAGDASEPPF